MKLIVKYVFLAVIALVAAGCVTTKTGPYEDKKDLDKAEKTYIQIGYGYFQKGDLLKSKENLMNALDINSQSAGAHMGLARVYERELEFELSDDHFRKAIKYNGGTEAHFQYAVYLYNRGNLEASIDEFDTVLKDTLYARRAQAFDFKGLVANRLGMKEEAILAYQKAIVLNPSMSSSYLSLAAIYKEQEDYARAYRTYNGFVRLVRAKLARQNASTLWLGIQLAHEQDDSDAYASYALQLKNQYSKTKEYAQFMDWQKSL